MWGTPTFNVNKTDDYIKVIEFVTEIYHPRVTCKCLSDWIN